MWRPAERGVRIALGVDQLERLGHQFDGHLAIAGQGVVRRQVEARGLTQPIAVSGASVQAHGALLEAHRLFDPALVRAHDGEQLADSGFLEGISGAVLEELQCRVQAPRGAAKVGRQPQRVAFHRPGTGSDVVHRTHAVSRDVQPIRSFGSQLGVLQRALRIVEAVPVALFDELLGNAPGRKAGGVAHQQESMSVIL